MSLSFILDDIADKTSGCKNSTESVTCLGHLEGLPILIERAKIVDASVHTRRLLQGVLKSDAISKEAALEAFTMLPIANDDTMLLTQAPTEHNRKLVEKATANIFNNLEVENAVVADVLDVVGKTIESSKILNEVCIDYSDQIQKHLDRLTRRPSIVIIGKTSINLLTSNIWDICNIDTYAIGYKPYEGVLDAKFRALTTHSVMVGLLQNAYYFKTKDGVPTLSHIADYVCNQAKAMLNQQQSLTQTQLSLSNYLVTGDKLFIETTSVGYALDTLNQIKEHEKLFTGQDCFAATLLECMSVLV